MSRACKVVGSPRGDSRLEPVNEWPKPLASMAKCILESGIENMNVNDKGALDSVSALP
jgi:hypothetical protein